MTNHGPTAQSAGPSRRPGPGQVLSQPLSLLSPKRYLQCRVLSYTVFEHLLLDTEYTLLQKVGRVLGEPTSPRETGT